jgi:hypothetical protein
MKPEQHEALRRPFPKSAIGKMPKGGTYLDYVGHAATTDRLLAVDHEWSWEPVAFDPRGLPQLDEFGGLWIRLTVCGVTRYGYGDAAGKKGPNAVKEAIGDAIRNAAMRFGVALDLWAKEDISNTTDAPQERKAERLRAVPEDDPFYSVPVSGGDGMPAGADRGEAVAPAGPGRPFMDSPDGPPTQKQMGMLGALLKGQTREQALALVGTIVGRDIASRDELTKREISSVIDALKKAEAAS